MNRPPLDRRTAKAFRRQFRFGIGPGTRTTPPVPAPLGADMERLVRPADEWDTGQLAAIYPDAGQGWRAPR